MSWKSSSLFMIDDPSEALENYPGHDFEKGEIFRHRLELSHYLPKKESSLLKALFPYRDALYIGAYPGIHLLCENDIPCYFFENETRIRIAGRKKDSELFVKKTLSLYPNSELLSIILDGVVGLWGFSYYKEGKMMRSAAGADGELFCNLGDPIEEEKAPLDRYSIEEIANEGWGEELVFEVSKKVFGKRMDELNVEKIPLHEYKIPGAKGFFQKILN